MRWVTANADVWCTHRGTVGLVPSQTWVRVDGIPVLVAPDLEHRPVTKCLNSATYNPCLETGQVVEGYSPWIAVDGHPVVTGHAHGLVAATTAAYSVVAPGQSWVFDRGEGSP